MVKRRLYTHNQLLEAAKAFANQAEGDAEFNSAMACVVFCALALEATLNYIGSATAAWDDHPKTRLSPKRKSELIASHAQYKVDFDHKPFEAFRVLFELHNQLVHSRTQDLSYGTATHWLVYGDRRWPAAQWESLCTAQHAQSFLGDTEQMMAILHRISGVEAVPPFLLSEHVAPGQQDV